LHVPSDNKAEGLIQPRALAVNDVRTTYGATVRVDEAISSCDVQTWGEIVGLSGPNARGDHAISMIPGVLRRNRETIE